MKTVKTIENLLLAVVLVFVLGACGSGTKSENANASVAQNITAGNNTTTTGEEDNTTTTPTVALSSLALTVDKTSLNKDENTTLKVTATYSDNTTKDVTDKVAWVIVPSDAVKVTQTTLTALKDKAVMLKAKLANQTSNAINLNITWVVNGHVLPPEPDPKVNNATLLGVDVNHNGVRDDVERWIYEEYKDKHPIHIDIAMQAARGYKLVLETPERAKEIHDEVNSGLNCELYYRYCVDDVNINEKRLISENQSIDNKFFRKKIYFNTEERERVYIKYDILLSGDSYTLPRCKKQKQFCDFNTSKYEE